MLDRFIKSIHKIFISSENKRTAKAKKNIVASLGLKVVSVLISFLMVPLCLDYLDKTRYGLWITIASVFTWFTFFEIGLGSGLKNYLAVALANNDLKKARIYVSTTYATLIIITTFISIVFFIIQPALTWTKILNSPAGLEEELSLLIIVVFCFFALRFILKLIETILYADQRTALSNIFAPLANFISIILIIILTKFTNGSLLWLGIILGGCPILVLIGASIYYFNSRYKEIRPSIKFVDFSYARDLFSLGFKFFIIQISTLILFQSSNLIIAHFMGPAEVTIYNVAYSYCAIVNILFTIIVTPYWPAFTEAWAKKDTNWIKKSINSLLKIWIIILAGAIVLLIISNPFYKIWVGNEVEVPFYLTLVLILYFLTISFGGIFNMFINGTGKIKMQTYSLLISAVFFYPIAYYLSYKLNLGLIGVVLAMIMANFYLPIIAPLQYYKIVNGRAEGIWNK